MNSDFPCPLCSSFTNELEVEGFFKCSECNLISRNPNSFLSKEDEKNRYDTHNNDVHDAGYRKFLSPIVNQILLDFKASHQGLDFGCGPGPVATVMLREEGFRVELYDPFYFPDKKVLDRTYNFIICSEVVEHFYKPRQEFELLKSLLKPGGKLYIMTYRYEPDTNFQTWYYKNDPSHVVFYAEETFHWIAAKYGFESPQIFERMIVLSNPA